MITLMKYTISAAFLIFASTLSAQGMNPSMMQQQGMPMGTPGMMPMNPQNMPMSDSQRYEMMMGQGNYGMMMDPSMRNNMMQYPHGNGMQRHMMNPQMMQMRQQHMNELTQRLERIEALLNELVQSQKAK